MNDKNVAGILADLQLGTRNAQHIFHVRVHYQKMREDVAVSGSILEKLLLAAGRGRWDRPLSADEILAIGREVLEPLFQEPPVGPIPEYLAPHWSVHGCVAEYEEKLEELDRWKALQLGRWLKDRVGGNWCVAGKVYQLQVENEAGDASEKFWLKLIDL